MSPYDFVHLALKAFGGKVQGKTRLQKLVYFLGVMTDSVDQLGYRPHFYGPYSPDVANGIGRLRALGFVDEHLAGYGQVNQLGFEVARHDFSLNEAGSSAADLKATQCPGEWQEISSAAETLTASDPPDYMMLSVAAKTHFLLGEKRSQATVAELSEMAAQFGWAVTPAEVLEAARFLERIHLVKVTEGK